MWRLQMLMVAIMTVDCIPKLFPLEITRLANHQVMYITNVT